MVENFPNLIKIIYENPTANTILDFERLNTFPLRSRPRIGYLLSSLLFNIVLDILARTTRQEKEKGMKIGKEVIIILICR